MYGALLGDMIGAPYEFDRGNKSKEFPLFCENSRFTDDSVMTIAVAEALLDSRFLDDDSIRAALIKSMRKWGKKYPDAGYGRKFLRWLREKDSKPYGSCGNGSAMRVSAAGWLFDTLEETREKARLTAEVTHDHPEGIKGAEAFYGVPAILKAECKRRLPEDMAYILGRFDISREHSHDDFPGDTLSGSGIIDEAIDRGCQTGSKENRIGVSDGMLGDAGRRDNYRSPGTALPVDKRPDQYDFER